MNMNYLLKCKTCSCIVRLRIQAGYYNWIPFTYECPQCKVICKGEVSIPSQVSPISKKRPEVITNLRNCENFDQNVLQISGEIDSVIQLSTELYTEKIIKSEGIYSIFNLSPHLKYAINKVNDQDLQTFVERFLTEINEKEEDYSALWNLYEKSPDYFNIKKEKLGIENKDNSGLNESKKIGFLQDFLFSEIRKRNIYIDKKNEIFNILEKIKTHKEITKLTEFIKCNYRKDIKKIYTVTSNFLNYYNYILPVVANESTNTFKISDVKEKWGIAQTDLETTKNFFSENYEDLKDLLIILILMNNIYYRNKIDKFHEKFYIEFKNCASGIENDTNTFNEKIKNVGNRLKILNYDNKIQLIDKVFDNEIRNSIDHRDYEYNYNEQKITFYNKKEKRSIYLIEFGEYLFNGFILANILWDLMMELSELGNIKLNEL